MGSFDNCALRIVTYNRRGLNDTKKLYVNQILAGCDILFLQEHWQSDDQLGCFNSISSEHASVGVSGFSNCDVLRGRPYGGCAIFWRKALEMSVTQIPTNSRRVCAILMHGACIRLLCICVYMPYEKDSVQVEEFLQQLSVVDTLINQHSASHIIVGGDFNVDFSRNWLHTEILDDYCENANLFPVIRHDCSSVEYTHQSGMQYFSSIDHFVLSEQLYRTSVNSQRVLHDTDNTSDHDPVWLNLDLSISHLSYYHSITPPKVAWPKANSDHITAYENMLRCELRSIDIPHEVLSCRDYSCKNAAHIHELDQFARKLTDTCLLSAKATIPFTKQCGSSGRIPGWNEYIAPFRRESFFGTTCGRIAIGQVRAL